MEREETLIWRDHKLIFGRPEKQESRGKLKK